jgi:hypothetical protein
MFARSFSYKKKNAQLSPAAYEWLTEDRWGNDDNNRSVLLLFVVHLTFFIIHKNSSGYIWVNYNANHDQYSSKLISVFFFKYCLSIKNIETCSKVNRSYSSTNFTNTVNECICWWNSMSFMWLFRSNKIYINWEKWL